MTVLEVLLLVAALEGWLVYLLTRTSNRYWQQAYDTMERIANQREQNFFDATEQLDDCRSQVDHLREEVMALQGELKAQSTEAEPSMSEGSDRPFGATTWPFLDENEEN